MNQTIEKTPTNTTAVQTLDKLVDARREGMLKALVELSIKRGDAIGKTVHLCNVFNACRFEHPLAKADVERKVTAFVAAINRAEKRAAELAETDADKVVAILNKKFVWLTRPMAIYDLESRCIVKKEALKLHYANTCVMLMCWRRLKTEPLLEAVPIQN